MGFLSNLLAPPTQRQRPAKTEQRGIHPSTDMDWGAWLGGFDRLAGLPTPTVASSMTQPAVWACVRVLAETVATLPLHLYRTTRSGGRERATNHRLYSLLHRLPNPELTSFEFEELLTSHCATWGNAYAYMDLNNAGQVIELTPLRPDRMSIARNAAGELVYIYTLSSGEERRLAAWQMHHRHGLSSDGIVGYSPVRQAMLAIALSMATEEFGARFFAQGAQPGFLLSYPGVLKDDAYARLAKRWNADTAGLTNAHKVKILEEGLKVEKVGIPPEEAQFLQTRVFQAQEVARMFRMPPHKIGLLENATFSNIEHQAIEFLTDTIQPWLRRNEAAMWRDMLTEAERQTMYMEYLVEGMLRGDTKTRYESYAIGRQWGWLSVNDIRAMENRDLIADGDVYLQPLNMVEAGIPSAPTATGTRSVVTWIAPIVEDAARRIVRREAQDLRTQGAKALRSEGFDVWLNNYYEELANAANQILSPAVAAAARAAGRSEERTAAQVSGVLWHAARSSMDKARLVVREASGQGTTPAAALEQYAGMVDAAGPAGLVEQVLAVIAAESD